MVIFFDFFVFYRHTESCRFAASIFNPDRISGITTNLQSRMIDQSKYLWKAILNSIIVSKIFLFSSSTVSVIRRASVSHSFTWEYSDGSQRVFGCIRAMNCCRLPTVPPNMASLTAKSLFQFHHILVDPHANSSNCDLLYRPSPSATNETAMLQLVRSHLQSATCQRTSKNHG